MKRITYVWIAALLLAALASHSAIAQSSDSLGDYARANRKDKKATAKQFDNDNLPKNDKLSVVGQPPADPDNKSDGAQADANAVDPRSGEDKPADKATDKSQAPEADAAKSAPKADDAAKKPADDTKDEAKDDAAAKQKSDEGWKNRISAQKEKLDLLTRELDVMQREYRLRAAAFYADAGNRMRNAGTWDQEDAKYKDQIDQKQKAIDSAKQELNSLQDQARKEGVPAGMRE
jgi:hypothetical protein